MFIDLNLKTESREALEEALIGAGFVKDEEGFALSHPEASLDVIGVVCADTGKTEEVEGEVIAIMEPVEGFHANVRTTDKELAKKLEAIQVFPVTPVRVWA